ncbi:MAG: hypothetical protein CBD88_04455 [Flavobacteriales bacterium TMED228]|nr:MAG: hypothetical protein CBD88_04455 [Flavobacteriales bacterium TMED228]|tara:strand:- start:440 stop:664 length:225 start_codon:yes stop_codon:yes gene_type:complete
MRTVSEMNCATGEIVVREMNADEIADAEALNIAARKEQEDQLAAAEKAAADKASGNAKLKDLGLTDDEIAALTS